MDPMIQTIDTLLAGAHMKLTDLAQKIGAKILTPGIGTTAEISRIYAGDRVSDLLNEASDKTLLVTNLANLQMVRVAELMEVPGICFVEGADPGHEIVDLATETMTGVEALLRWRHPTRGIIAPAAFIPLAEESGLIVPIGAWVIHEACRQARVWLDAAPGRPVFSVGINLSAVQLDDPGLLAEITGAIEESGVPPQALLFELTETVVMADPERAAARMAVLKSLGVRLAIDDFGTGYSSLSYVRKFPVDVLKLDRSFITGLERDPSAIATAEVFVRLGQLLNLVTVAEGVETIAEADTLRRLECHMAQGFHFGRPTDPATIAARMSRPNAPVVALKPTG